MRLDKLTAKIAAIIACFALAQVSGCVGTSQETEGESYLTDTGTITEHPARFFGKSVLVRNDVSQMVGKRDFILDKDRLLEGEPILVINTSATSLEFTGDDLTPEVVVNGKVERLDLNSIKQQHSLDFESELYSQYEGKPVIIATSIVLSPDPEDITANPEMYYNKPLVIKGEVDEIDRYGIFEIDEEKAFGGEDLLVMQLESEVVLNEEQTVMAYGVVRQFIVEEIERDYALQWDSSTRTKMKAKYDKKPILVSDRIKIVR